MNCPDWRSSFFVDASSLWALIGLGRLRLLCPSVHRVDHSNVALGAVVRKAGEPHEEVPGHT